VTPNCYADVFDDESDDVDDRLECSGRRRADNVRPFAD
jgi:hypothetical protein